MGIKKDLTDQRFGKLVVKEEAGVDKRGSYQWLCKCDCGKIKTIRSDQLCSGHTQSCGCLQKEKATTHGMSKMRAYVSWSAMLNRCNNHSCQAYKHYGGRGITVCERWLKVENFIADMGERPKRITIERIDNDGNYEPGNCCWATYTIQLRNQRITPRNKTGVRGVSWIKERKRYRVDIMTHGKSSFIGNFKNLQQAIKARKEAELKYW